MAEFYVADTNVLLDNIEGIENYKIVLLSHTLRELDKHKTSANGELAYKARKAVRYIKENKEKFKFNVRDYDGSVLGKEFDSAYQDNNILAACVTEKYGIISNDILLQYKAEALDVDVDVVELDANKLDYNYTGVKQVIMTDDELADFYENIVINTYKLLTNEYLIIKNEHSETIDKFRWDGIKHTKLKFPKAQRKKALKAKNDEQACAIDLLYNKDIPIKFICGTYGSGKTYLTVKTALYHVQDEGNHSKIMVIRNPIGSKEAIGWLKGSKEDKTQDFFKPFVQHLEGGEQEAEILEATGKLVKEIPYYIKGLSIDDTYVVVDEAEDLDAKLLKLIGTRLGENSAVAFCGDFKQSEDKFIGNNGLREAISKLKGNPLVGIVVLEEDVRSDASRVFAEW